MWERFSYYGMRAILILFMTATVADGGLGFDMATAGMIYGLYTAMAYMAALPGGWIADRFLGLRRAVLVGGVLIAVGNFLLVIPESVAFYSGLALIVAGTGLLKPNVSAIVGQLYAQATHAATPASLSSTWALTQGRCFRPFCVVGSRNTTGATGSASLA